MKFLIDRCAGRRLADWLREQGYEVLESQEQRLEHLSRMLDQARRVLPLNLAALSLAFLRSLATRTQDEHLVAWVQKEAALHKEKVLLQPNGQKLWAGFLSMQSELQRAIG